MSVKDFVKRLQMKWLHFRMSPCKQLKPVGEVLILAPHPDDEVFGCGGLIARLVGEGRAPHVAILTGGGRAHRGCCDISEVDIIAARRKLTREAIKSFGLPESNLHEFDYNDGGVRDDHMFEKESLKTLIANIQPDIILVPHHGEGWPDHLAVRQIGLDMASANTEVWEYCVWMWYYMQRHFDWHSARQLKMSPAEHAAKLKAISIYQSAIAPCGNPWVGVLPNLFVKANSTDKELYFKIR